MEYSDLGSSWEQAQQVPERDNVDDNAGTETAGGTAIGGYAWTRKRGYFILPEDARLDIMGVSVWHHDSQAYKSVVGTGLVEDDDTWSVHSWNSGAWKSKWEWSDDRRGPGAKDGDVPEWDGKSEHRSTYFRRIDLWAATTGVPPNQRGCRLLQKLKGEAFEKLENIEPTTLLVEDSIARFK